MMNFRSRTQHFFMNQGWIQDDFWRDSIWSNFRTYSTYPDRQAWANSVDPDQMPQNACKTFTEMVMYLTKDLESLQELEFTCLFVTTNGKIWLPLHWKMIWVFTGLTFIVLKVFSEFPCSLFPLTSFHSLFLCSVWSESTVCIGLSVSILRFYFNTWQFHMHFWRKKCSII